MAISDEKISNTSRPLSTVSSTSAAPPGDTAHLKRIEDQLHTVEQSLAEIATIDHADESCTTLAVSIVIPVYNEHGTIAEIVERVQSVGVHQEIVIVDDFSTDGTRDVLLELAKQSDIRVILHGYNRGKGAAIRTALAEAEGEVVLIQDADLEYDPNDYPKLLAPIERGEAEVVYGSRFLENPQQDRSWLHRAGNRLLTALSNYFTGQRLTDMETCYKVFRTSLLPQIEIEQNRFGFEPEITAKFSRLGQKIVEVPVRYNSRGYEEGKKIGIRDGLNAIYCILKYRAKPH